MSKIPNAWFAGALLMALPLAAAPITLTTGSSATLNFNGFYDANKITIPGLTGQVLLSNFSFTPTLLSGQAATIVALNYVVNNNSTSPTLTSRISGFAFNTTPDILTTAPNSVSGLFDTVVYAANQPNGIGTVEMCWATIGCPGGGGGGVDIGGSAGGSASLYFAGTLSSLNIDTAFLRYQSVTCSAGSPCNGSASGDPSTYSDYSTPEPSSFGLLSLGLAGAALALRQKHRS
jgi:hypothetical protein